MHDLAWVSVSLALAGVVCFLIWTLSVLTAKSCVNAQTQSDPKELRAEPKDFPKTRGNDPRGRHFQAPSAKAPESKVVNRRKEQSQRYSHQGHESLFGDFKKSQVASVKQIVIRERSVAEAFRSISPRAIHTAGDLRAVKRQKSVKTAKASKDMRVWTAYSHDNFVIMRNRFLKANSPDVTLDYNKAESPLLKHKSTAAHKSPTITRIHEGNMPAISLTPKSPDKTATSKLGIFSTPEAKPTGLFEGGVSLGIPPATNPSLIAPPQKAAQSSSIFNSQPPPSMGQTMQTAKPTASLFSQAPPPENKGAGSSLFGQGSVPPQSQSAPPSSLFTTAAVVPPSSGVGQVSMKVQAAPSKPQSLFGNITIAPSQAGLQTKPVSNPIASSMGANPLTQVGQPTFPSSSIFGGQTLTTQPVSVPVSHQTASSSFGVNTGVMGAQLGSSSQPQPGQSQSFGGALMQSSTSSTGNPQTSAFNLSFGPSQPGLPQTSSSAFKSNQLGSTGTSSLFGAPVQPNVLVSGSQSTMPSHLNPTLRPSTQPAVSFTTATVGSTPISFSSAMHQAPKQFSAATQPNSFSQFTMAGVQPPGSFQTSTSHSAQPNPLMQLAKPQQSLFGAMSVPSSTPQQLFSYQQ